MEYTRSLLMAPCIKCIMYNLSGIQMAKTSKSGGLKTSDKWFVRITAPWEHLKSKIITIREWIDYDGMMIGYHHGDKQGAPHMHVCLKLKGQAQKQKIDTRFKTLYGVEKGQYSSKIWDGAPEALSYLYHDKNGEVVNMLGLSEAEVIDLQRLNNQIQVVVQENKKRASNRVVDYVLEKTETTDRYEIATMILEAVADGQFYDPGDFQLEKYINEIELKNAKKESKEKLSLSIQARISRLQSFRRY